MFDFSFHNVNYNMQSLLVKAYDYFKIKLEKKSGLFRKYLMGKNVDYCTRTVISNAQFHANRPEEMMIDFRNCGVPLAQVCSLCYPYILQWVKNFFELNVINSPDLRMIDPQTGELGGKTATIERPDTYFTEKYFKKKIDQFVKGPETRFEPIEVPLTDGTKKYLAFTGRIFTPSIKGEQASISHRRMTWTDLLYMAAVDITKDKHVIVTRYPVTDVYGIFIARIRVVSTQRTVPMQVGERVYQFYPQVDLSLTPEEVVEQFIESAMFSNSYLPGINGDCKPSWSPLPVMVRKQICERLTSGVSYLIAC